jgi:hypothetical protein
MTLSRWRDRVMAGAGAAVLSAGLVACGQAPGVEAPGTPPPSPPAAPAPPPAPKPATTVTLIEPTDGAISGHIDLFRWAAVDGADGYNIRILGSDGRVVFDSPLLTATEAHLPKTVALEPEAHTWTVTARKGGEALVTSPVFKFTITP